MGKTSSRRLKKKLCRAGNSKRRLADSQNVKTSAVTGWKKPRARRRPRRSAPYPDNQARVELWIEDQREHIISCSPRSLDEEPSPSHSVLNQESSGCSSSTGSESSFRSLSPVSRAAAYDDGSSSADGDGGRSLSLVSLATAPEDIATSPPALIQDQADDTSDVDSDGLPTTPTAEHGYVTGSPSPSVKAVFFSKDSFDVPGPIKGLSISSDGGIHTVPERLFHFMQQLGHDDDRFVAQFFNGSPYKGVKSARAADIQKFREHVGGEDTTHWVMHGNHTTNLASAIRKTSRKGFNSVKREMKMCVQLRIKTLCIHLGSFQKLIKGVWQAGSDAVIDRVAKQIEKLLKAVPGVNLAIENMARNNLSKTCNPGHNWSLRQIKRIIDKVGDKRIKVCVDLCHAFIGDRNLRKLQGLEDLLDDIEAFGDNRIACVHVSDSIEPHGSKCEGHTRVGNGLIPLTAFRRLLRRRDLLGKVPYFLESPAHIPFLRPKDNIDEYHHELRLKRLEWEALEYLIRVPDSAWSEQHGVHRIKQMLSDSQSIRKFLNRAAGQGDSVKALNKQYQEKRQRLMGVARQWELKWKKEVLDATGGISEAYLTPGQRYEREIALINRGDGSGKQVKSCQTDTDSLELDSEPSTKRSAGVAASCSVTLLWKHQEEAQELDPIEEPYSSADECWSGTPPSKQNRYGPRKKRRPAPAKRYMRRIRSSSVGGQRRSKR